MPEKIGVYICQCGVNISNTVDVYKLCEYFNNSDIVNVARTYKFMCSEPGQEMIKEDIIKDGLTRIVVAACSPQMHELTFRDAVENAGLNRYLFQMANIREQCSWIHEDKKLATEKAKALINAAVYRVILHKPLTTEHVKINPKTLIVGAGISGIQAALDIAESGNDVYLVERDSTIGGHMAQFDKTFPTLDCSACILTPKMVSVGHRKNIHLMTYSEVKDVSGYVGNFKVTVGSKPRYVNEKCTSCGDCADVCPVSYPDKFDEFKSEHSAIHKAFPQAVPNTYVIDKHSKPPCVAACPIDQHSAGYVTLVNQKKFREAVALIRKHNPLPSVCGRTCYHHCESTCSRGYVEEPVAIQHIKRFLIDWEMQNTEEIKPPETLPPRDEKVAIIGSGPAGLAAAHDLALLGYRPEIFEKLPKIGGMLSVGIPDFRLPEEILNFEIDYIRKMGVTIFTEKELGKDYTLESLEKDGYSAIFLGIGAHKSVKLGVPGEKLSGVYHGIDFLREFELNKESKIGKRIAVIGGGNTAIDVSRTLTRLGAEKVTIVYRRTRAEMPASVHEINDAEQEGVEIKFLSAPVEILGDEKVIGMKCIQMELGEPDDSGRRRPVPIEGSEEILDFDTIIIAISQEVDFTLFGDAKGLKPSSIGTLYVNQETLETGMPGVFAGGDLVKGPYSIIDAIAHGRQAAEAIDKYINKMPIKDLKTYRKRSESSNVRNFRPHKYAPLYKDIPKVDRVKMSKLELEERHGSFEEVELGYTIEEAVEEAARCLNCGVCVECLECERICEPNAVDHSMQYKETEIDVGQIIVSTGFDLFDPTQVKQYGYGKLDNVITSLDFERMVNATGFTDGKILLSDGNEPKSVGIVHCVGSRDENYNKYCSKVCCMYSLKFAHLVKERTNAEVYQYYIDMRASGKGYEEFYSRILMEGSNVIRGKVAEIVESKISNGNGRDKTLLVRCEDTLIGKFREIPVDMAILCCALEPKHDAENIARLFSISRSPDGFFLEQHPKLNPTGTTTEGLYLTGCCQGPKDIPESVAQAGSAAAKVLSMIAKGEVGLDPMKAEIESTLCSGCRMCNNLCPYSAISFNEAEKLSDVNQALCKGCGTCVAACPAGAIIANGFSDEQILSEIEAILI